MHRMRGNGHVGIQETPLSFWTVKVIKYQNSLVRYVVELPNIAEDIPNPDGFGPGNPGLDNPLWCLPTANPGDADVTGASTVSTAQGTLPWHWDDT